MAEYRIKDWKKYQHYRHRSPPWIKLHKTLLDDPDFFELDGDDSKVLIMLWLVASEHHGELPRIKRLAFQLRLSERDISSALSRLSHWIERDASNTLAVCLHGADSETETETETETDPDPETESYTESERGVQGGKQVNGHPAGKRAKPPHGIKTKDGKRVWLDRGTPDWNNYAAAYAERHDGVAPPTQWNGSGTWFDMATGDA